MMKRNDYDGARLRKVILDEYVGWRRHRAEGRRLVAESDRPGRAVWDATFDHDTGSRMVHEAEIGVETLNTVRHAMFDRPRHAF